MESGKWYWEIYLHSQNSGGVLGIGIGQSRRSNALGGMLQHYGYSPNGCLLYTSDAADDSLRVDLGGRRIIK